MTACVFRDNVTVTERHTNRASVNALTFQNIKVAGNLKNNVFR